MKEKEDVLAGHEISLHVVVRVRCRQERMVAPPKNEHKQTKKKEENEGEERTS